jgi:hypothetical protein
MFHRKQLLHVNAKEHSNDKAKARVNMNQLCLRSRGRAKKQHPEVLLLQHPSSTITPLASKKEKKNERNYITNTRLDSA